MLDTVTVACKLPNGLHLENITPAGVKVRVTLMGARLPVDANGREIQAFELAGSFGLTPNVPRDFWEQWVKENANYGPYKQGMIFAQDGRDNARAQARELEDVRTGLEPMPADKPAPGITAVSKD